MKNYWLNKYKDHKNHEYFKKIIKNNFSYIKSESDISECALLLKSQEKINEDNDFGPQFNRISYFLLIKSFILVNGLKCGNDEIRKIVITDIKFAIGTIVGGKYCLSSETEDSYYLKYALANEIKRYSGYKFQGIGLNQKYSDFWKDKMDNEENFKNWQQNTKFVIFFGNL